MMYGPTICVVCDECGCEEEFELTLLAGGGWDDRNLKAQMANSGWRADFDAHYCDDCATERSPKP